MLEVKITGGLGNQMFQYAFCQYLKSAQNEVRLNALNYRVCKFHEGFELKRVFDIKECFSDKKSTFGVDTTTWYSRIIRKLFHVKLVKFSEYHENPAVTNVPYKKLDTNIFFVGFWQNYRYIEPVEAELRKIFLFPKLEGKNEEFYQQIRNKETVAIHVRRGDYLKITGMSNICDERYYKSAIQCMREKLQSPVFIFFSDDSEWCKKVFKDMDALYVDWNKGEESYRDMQLMSLCKHNIIANSTFSWWGAWLNSSEEKIMIAPHRWSPFLEENYLCGKGWILI